MEFDENLFKVASEKVVKTLSHRDGTCWIPNKSQIDSRHLQLYHLVERKAGKFSRLKNKYSPMKFKLVDVLHDQQLDQVSPDEVDAGCHTKTSTMMLKGSIKATLANAFGGNLSVGSHCSLQVSMGELYTQMVEHQELLDAIQNKRLNKNHQLLKQIKERKDKDRMAICIVTGIVKARCEPKRPILKAKVRVDGDAGVQGTTPVGIKVEVVGKLTYATLKEYEVPKDSVLAYQVVELKIDENTGTVRPMVYKGSKGGFHVLDIFAEGQGAVKSLLRQVSLAKGGFMGGDGGLAGDHLSCKMLIEIKPEDVKKDVTACMAGVSTADRKRLAEIVLEFCAEPQLLEDVLEMLEDVESANTDNESIQALLDIARMSADVKYVAMLCDALTNLDEEAQYFLSSLDTKDIPVLYSLMAFTFKGEVVPLDSPLLTQLTASSRARNFLLTGLNYSITGDGLVPSNNLELIESAFSAFEILEFMLE